MLEGGVREAQCRLLTVSIQNSTELSIMLIRLQVDTEIETPWPLAC
ncbi:hypothetical protein POX_c03887 [Penicillium oxalicum]|nr:hypothetical protein POX_c03887 [Penicillium oxalicum]KAI2791032.1 hypothetical protein POX_c03887 [Penicillium oxalicum]